MNYIRSIRDSIYNPSFYREVPSQTKGQAFKYYFLFIALLAVAITVITSIRTVPAIRNFTSGLGSKIVSYYPGDLVVTIKDGHASINQPEPYYLAMPDALKNSFSNRADKSYDHANLLVIDTKSPASLEAFTGYDTVAYLTSDSLMTYKDNAGQVVTQPLSDVKDMTVDKNLVESLVAKIAPLFGLIPPLFVAGALVGIYFALAFKLLYLFFLALLVMAIARVYDCKLSYGVSYRMSLYLATAPFIIDWASGLIPGFHMQFLFTIVFLIAAFVNLRGLRGLILEPAVDATPQTPPLSPKASTVAERSEGQTITAPAASTLTQ